MTRAELLEDIDIDREALELTLNDVQFLLQQTGERLEFSRFEKAAATSFLQQLYNGIENIMKRICKFHGVPVPYGGESHRELADLFVESVTTRLYEQLPVLIPAEIRAEFNLLRRFRHVIAHGYSFSIEDARLKTALLQVTHLLQVYLSSVQFHCAHISGNS